jgi:hypothetical protein
MLMLIIESLDAGNEPVSLTAVRSGEEIMLRLYRQDPGEELPLSGKLLGSISLDREDAAALKEHL